MSFGWDIVLVIHHIILLGPRERAASALSASTDRRSNRSSDWSGNGGGSRRSDSSTLAALDGGLTDSLGDGTSRAVVVLNGLDDLRRGTLGISLALLGGWSDFKILPRAGAGALLARLDNRSGGVMILYPLEVCIPGFGPSLPMKMET
ncbi:hypothetical protein PG990_013212 [Apiospora arundinis]